MLWRIRAVGSLSPCVCVCVLSPQIGVLAALLTTISGVVSIDDIWGSEWDIVLISLQVGPLFRLRGVLFERDLAPFALLV